MEEENFMNGPLIIWLKTFPETPPDFSFRDLISGQFLSNVLRTFFEFGEDSDGYPTTTCIATIGCVSTEYAARIYNVEALVRNIKHYYERVLKQLLIIKLPDSLAICREPPNESSFINMEVLMLLVLGAAVQCAHKQQIIDSIKRLPIDTQHSIMQKIQEVTDNPEKIWPLEISEDDIEMRQHMFDGLLQHIANLVKERDNFAHRVVTLSVVSGSAVTDLESSNHLAVELAEYKAKLRKMGQQLEDKTEHLSEAKEETEKYTLLVSKLRQENLELVQSARAATTFRDEVDILRERAIKVDRLEAELLRYKDMVSDIEFYKQRVEELREDNRVLGDTKNMLDEQLGVCRGRSDRIFELENSILNYKSLLAKLEIEREADKKHIEDLLEENTTLQVTSKCSLSESKSFLDEMKFLRDGTRRNNEIESSIKSEQIDKDVSQIHRLEFEKQLLISQLEEIKVNGFPAHSETVLMLETEKKKAEMDLRALEKSSAKEIDNLEKSLRQIKATNVSLEEVVATLKQSEQDIRLEKDSQIDHLRLQLESLQKRRDQNASDQLMALEDENKKYVRDATLLQTEVSKLKHENERYHTKNVALSVELDKLRIENDGLTSEKADNLLELETFSKLKDEHETLSERHSVLMGHQDRLTKSNDLLRLNDENSRSTNRRLNIEVTQLKLRVESLKEDKQILDQRETDLQQNISNLRSSNEKTVEDLEHQLATSQSENQRLAKQKSNLENKKSELEREIKELESQNLKLEKSVSNLQMTANSVEKLEKELVDLEANFSVLSRDEKSLKKDVSRLRLSLSSKERIIDEQNSRLSSMVREAEHSKRELIKFKESQRCLDELEVENRNLNQSCAMSKETLDALRKELIDEKLKCEQLTNDLEADTKNSSSEQPSIKLLLANRDEKITKLEASVQVLRTKNASLVQNLELSKLESNGGAELETELRNAIQEKAKLHAANVSLLASIASSEKNISEFQRDIARYQDELFSLGKDRATLQVENSTLQSHSASLLSQINTLQINKAKLESQKQKSDECQKEWQQERNELLRDQNRLQRLHDSLQIDYDSLLKEKDEQRITEKNLRSQLKKLQDASVRLGHDQDTLIVAQENLNIERESLRTDARTLSNLRSEHARLKEDFRILFTSNERIKNEFCSLQSEYKSLKHAHNANRLNETSLKGELAEAKDKMRLYDVETSKAQSRCDVLQRLNVSLEEDKNSLMAQVSMLLTQYHELLTQTLNDKEHFHEEFIVYTDKMNNLHRQKEKLEEKIMDQYKRMDNITPKKVSFGSQLVRKVRKAGSSLISTSSSNASSMAAAHRQSVSPITQSLPALPPDECSGRSSSSSSSSIPSSVGRVPSSFGHVTRRNAFEGDADGEDGDDSDSQINLVEANDGTNGSVCGLSNYGGSAHSLDQNYEKRGTADQDNNIDFSGGARIAEEKFQTRRGQSAPFIYAADNRNRSARVYLIGGSDSSGDPRAAISSVQNSSPASSSCSNSEGQTHRNSTLSAAKYSPTPPEIPARKPSQTNMSIVDSISSQSTSSSFRPPERPPKRPSTVAEPLSESESCKREGALTKDRSAWYEYGCV